MKEALAVIAALNGQCIYADDLARLIWPDHVIWKEGGHGRKHGMAMAAGGMVGRLRKRGFVNGFCGGKYGIVVTPQGRQWLEDQKEEAS